MPVGKNLITILISAFIAICVFFVFQWLIPLIFGLVGFAVPGHIVNILAMLIAVGIFYYGGWRWKVAE